MGRKSKKRQSRATQDRTKNSRAQKLDNRQAPQAEHHARRITALQIELIGVIIGVLLTVFFTGVLGPDPFAGVRRYIIEQWRNRSTSEWDRLVGDYIDQTRHANIWMQPPAMYPESEQYFRDDPWGELNPQVPHQLPDNPELEIRPVEELVPESKAYAGRIVGTIGIIKRQPSKWEAMPNIPEWVVQIGSLNPNHKYEAVYCRVTTSPDVRLRQGEVVAVSGLILGAGQVKQTDGPGILDVAYMACSAIEKMPPPKPSRGNKSSDLNDR
jgi:hypothetical protein